MLLVLTYFFFLAGVYLVALLPALSVSLLGYFYALYYTRNDVADVLWPVGIASSAITLFLLIDFPDTVLSLAVILVVIWATRLSYHIASSFFSKMTEDDRYADLRLRWRFVKTRSFFQVFLLQALLMVVVLSPLVMFVFSPGYVPLPQILFALWLWGIGFYFQVVGDWQLARFMAEPERYGLRKGDLMTKGLWSRTRHPNYFGELCMWWALFVLTLHSLNLWYLVPAIVGPLVLTYLLYYVSGVRLSEKNWQKRYGEQYTTYKKSTPALLPRLW